LECLEIGNYWGGKLAAKEIVKGGEYWLERVYYSILADIERETNLLEKDFVSVGWGGIAVSLIKGLKTHGAEGSC